MLGFWFLVCVFHLGGPPGFLGYATKTQFWVTKWGGMLYEVIIQYGGWGGQGLKWKGFGEGGVDMRTLARRVLSDAEASSGAGF